MYSLTTKCTALSAKYLSSSKLLPYMFGAVIGFFAPIIYLLLWAAMFTIVDLITGIAASIKQGIRISSYRLRQSITKVVFYLLFLALLEGIDVHILTVSHLGLANMGCAIICIVELYSILENAYVITENRVFRILTSWTQKTFKDKTGCDIAALEKVCSDIVIPHKKNK